MHRQLSRLALLGLLGACGSPAPAPLAPAPVTHPAPPASALAGVVRALEALALARPADCVVEVRALEAEVRLAAESGQLCERVALDVSVFAPTLARALEVMDGLRAGLEAEAALRVEPVSEERVVLALADLGPRTGDEALLSASDRLWLELPPLARPVPAPRAAEFELASLDYYVRSRAAQGRAVGEVNLTRRDSRPTGLPAGVHLRIEPGLSFQRFHPQQIGVFLASLESDSPAVRVTQLTIERSAHEPDAKNPRGWTYAAELTVSAQAPAAGG